MKKIIGLIVAALSLVATSVAQAADALVGTFKIAPGQDSASGVKGSWFRMVQPGGSLGSGPFVSNVSSSASDDTYTFLSPGTDGGLKTGAFQPQPSPAFDALGNSLAGRIVDPTPFFAIDFAVSTSSPDPQTGSSVPAPALSYDGKGNISGNVRAFGAAWNNQQFNQGSPKPDGTTPGLTAGPTGHYDPDTGAYTLDWSSHIQGGPFDGFTGKWHLTGSFQGNKG